ncbi:uncharacterized protein LOC122843467 [Gambusia affinis]|uniref:uncharacterized protein LOC122843467 n=1 Tax=Gambusia affinis TaxID=33528 RepID=UPI001CDC04A0|nr:uncharacterized protein LOC122843467 [Gambusia affinis]
MEMTCGLGFGILLICLVQAELAGCSWAKDAHRPQDSNTNSGFPPPDGKLRKFSSNFQSQLKQDFFSPPSVQVQTSSFNTKPAARSGYDRKPSTSSLTQPPSQPVQSSGRLVKTTVRSKPKSQSTLPAQQSPRVSQREGYSFRPASYMDASSYWQKGSSATLFSSVGPGPRSSIRMQTFAKGRARKVPSGRASQGAKVRSFSPHAAAGRFYSSPQFALKTGDYRPRSRLTDLAGPRSGREGESALGFAPAMVYDLPEPFGGSAIKRLKRPIKQETPPQRVPLYKPERTSSDSGYDWSRIMQNLGPIQKPYWIATPSPSSDGESQPFPIRRLKRPIEQETPPQRVPLYKPERTSSDLGYDWSRTMQNLGPVQKPYWIATPSPSSNGESQPFPIRRLKRPIEQETPPQRVPLYKPERTSSDSGYDWSRTMQNLGPVQKPYWIATPSPSSDGESQPFPIRRLKRPIEQETPPQRVPLYKPERTSSDSGYDWSRTMQNLGPVQKPYWIATPSPSSDGESQPFPIRRLKRPIEQETPPQRVPLYKPEQTSSHLGYDWSRMKQNQGPVQKPYWIATP